MSAEVQPFTPASWSSPIDRYEAVPATEGQPSVHVVATEDVLGNVQFGVTTEPSAGQCDDCTALSMSMVGEAPGWNYNHKPTATGANPGETTWESPREVGDALREWAPRGNTNVLMGTLSDGYVPIDQHTEAIVEEFWGKLNVGACLWPMLGFNGLSALAVLEKPSQTRGLELDGYSYLVSDHGLVAASMRVVALRNLRPAPPMVVPPSWTPTPARVS